MGDSLLKRLIHIHDISIETSALAYSDGDQVGVDGLENVSEAVEAYNRSALLHSVTIVDKARQSAALELLLFKAPVSIVSVDNAALDISDADMAEHCIGAVKIAAADYRILANSSVATKLLDTPLPLKFDTRTLYCILKTTGTPTYGAAEGILTAKLGLFQA